MVENPWPARRRRSRTRARARPGRPGAAAPRCPSCGRPARCCDRARAGARAGPADVPAQQQQVHQLLHVADAVPMLREAHRPARDRAPARRVELRQLAHLAPRDAGTGLELLERVRLERLREAFEARGVLGEERPVENAAALGVEREQLLHHALEQRDVAAHAHAHEALGQLRAGAEQAGELLGMLEAHQPALAQRVHAHDVAAAARRLLERGQHARVVAAGVLADHEDQISLSEVRERDGALADADHLAEADAARLVTQVRAVGQVVRAVLAHEELVEERGLVARAARGVEDGLVGRGERAERLARALEGGSPRDGLEAVAAGAQAERLGQPALRLEPAVGLLAQLRHRPREPELAPERARGRFVRHRLRAVLAELDGAALSALGPGAARAVEAVLLVDDAQRGQRAREAGAQGVQGGLGDRSDPAGGLVVGHAAGSLTRARSVRARRRR